MDINIDTYKHAYAHRHTSAHGDANTDEHLHTSVDTDANCHANYNQHAGIREGTGNALIDTIAYLYTRTNSADRDEKPGTGYPSYYPHTEFDA